MVSERIRAAASAATSRLPEEPSPSPEIEAFRRRSENARRAALSRHGRQAAVRQLERSCGPGNLPELCISDETVSALAPVGCAENSRMIRWVRQHVSCAPSATVAEIARLAGVPVGTAKRWRRDPRVRCWISDVLMEAGGHVVPLLWRRVLGLALQGNGPAIRMYLQRFDPLFDGRVPWERPERREPEPEVDDEAWRAARRVLRERERRKKDASQDAEDMEAEQES